MKRISYFLIIFFLYTKSTYALIEIDITRGNLDPLPIAVSPLHVDIKSETYKNINIKELGSEISKIIEKILKIQDYLILLKKKHLSKNQILLILNQDLKIGD